MKKVISGLIIVVVGYVISYLVNSFCGGYWPVPQHDGEDTLLGIPISSAILWQPRFGYNSPKESDFIGTFYHPLIWVDRKTIHRTKYLSEGETWTSLTGMRWHPGYEEE